MITKAVAIAAAFLRFGGIMLERMNAFLWGVPVLGLILGTGVWLTGITGFVQVRLFPAAMREFWRRLRDRDSGFRALCTALAATVGTGNIAGVAGAIAIGGPGRYSGCGSAPFLAWQ